ncbi:hypothetical protein G7074_01650 [Pedobacter sp. HDW13]|uniref:hypothetical protein n=1 Tax=Pedobacter sp. HDW13 TaxID=2714940 RepID=UPI001409BE34|nr:hypothetical protein [Pedobacter sp. HDW13]QIL38094.1 hypothetical protein G7074_01650 [Pedobacter sp. HDW13]
MTDLDYLINQLDLLIGFLDVSDEHIYKQIKTHDRFKLGLTIEQLYDYKYENYLNHITTSALLLGFTHFEDFITKAIIKILIKYPNKNEIKVNLRTVKEKGDNLIDFCAQEQARRLIFVDKIKFLEKNLKGLTINILNDLRDVNDIRNCLMHNNGLADNRLMPRYTENQKIILTSGEVNGFGLQSRQLAREIWARI